MARRCYISLKMEDREYKRILLEDLHLDIIDHSLDAPINSTNEDYIMQVIRRDYLSNSTVTLFLIGSYGAESRGWEEQKYIKRELQASLYHGPGNTQNGILGIVLPSMYTSIFGNAYICNSCGGQHHYVGLNDSTTIREFSCNYYIPHGKCAWSEEDRFCVLAKWDEFILNPEYYIEQAFEKRSAPIAERTRVYP